MGDTVTHNPCDAVGGSQEGYAVPPGSGHPGVGEKVLKLLVAVHAQRLEPVAGTSRTQDQLVTQSCLVQIGGPYISLGCNSS